MIVLRMEPVCERRAQAPSVCGVQTLPGRGFRPHVRVLATLQRRSLCIGTSWVLGNFSCVIDALCSAAG